LEQTRSVAASCTQHTSVPARDVDSGAAELPEQEEQHLVEASTSSKQQHCQRDKMLSLWPVIKKVEEASSFARNNSGAAAPAGAQHAQQGRGRALSASFFLG
jgi:hypothetical protein